MLNFCGADLVYHQFYVIFFQLFLSAPGDTPKSPAAILPLQAADTLCTVESRRILYTLELLEFLCPAKLSSC